MKSGTFTVLCNHHIIHFQNFFNIPSRNSVLIKQYVQKSFGFKGNVVSQLEGP